MSTPMGQNPYGDEAGLAPNFDYQSQQIKSAYDTALNQLNTQNNAMFQQYGVNHTSPQISLGAAIGDPAHGAAYTSFAVDPSQQYGNIQSLNRQQGGIIQNLMQQGIHRNAGQFGMARAQEGAARFAADQDRTKLYQGLLDNEQQVLQAAQSAHGTEQTGLSGVGQNKANFEGWAGTHYVSDGGNVADPITSPPPAPTQFSSVVGDIGQLFNTAHGANAKANLGRIRDQLRQITHLGGYDRVQTQKLVDQYTQSLHKSKQLYYSKKWQIPGFNPTGHQPPGHRGKGKTHHGSVATGTITGQTLG